MRCCGYGEGCECSSCLNLRMENQREWEHYHDQQQEDQYKQWVRDQQKSVDEEPF